MNSTFKARLERYSKFYLVRIPDEVAESLDLRAGERISVDIRIPRSSDAPVGISGSMKGNPSGHPRINKDRKR